MKVYFGVRTNEQCKVFWWDTSTPERPKLLPMALELRNHSPDGPEWGYTGSGPAQLALALLYHCTGNAFFAEEMHQVIKAHLVAILPHEVWARTELDILACACDAAPTPALLEKARLWYDHVVAACRKRGGAING